MCIASGALEVKTGLEKEGICLTGPNSEHIQSSRTTTICLPNAMPHQLEIVS